MSQKLNPSVPKLRMKKHSQYKDKKFIILIHFQITDLSVQNMMTTFAQKHFHQLKPKVFAFFPP